MYKIPIPLAERIDKLNDYQSLFNAEVGGALKWVMRMQDINSTDLSSRIRGISSSSWRSYTQMSYTNHRPLHAVASFSWVTQVSMLAILKGNSIQKYWPGVSDETIQCIVQTGLLPEEQFEYLAKIMLSKLERRGYYLREHVISLVEKIPKFSDSFLMPDQLDIEDFKRDYYCSIAQQLQLFRENNNIPIELLAAALNEPVDRVKAFEDPKKSVSIPVFAAVRLKLCFDISDTVSFTSGMKNYHCFYLSREVQQAREKVIIVLFHHLFSEDRNYVINLVNAVLDAEYQPSVKMLNHQRKSQIKKPALGKSVIETSKVDEKNLKTTFELRTATDGSNDDGSPLCHVLLHNDNSLSIGKYRVTIGDLERRLALEENAENTINTLAGSMAHELCNPLVKINSLVELAREEIEKDATDRNQEKLEEYLRLIEQSSDGGIKLARSMLQFTQTHRFNSNQFAQVNITDTVMDALQLYPFKLGEKERVTADIDLDFVFFGSGYLIHYVLFNLLKNALYYENSLISIETELSEQGNCLIFSDTGAGIPKGLINTIFDDFSTSNKMGGFGLGLPFCKRAMLSMNGGISYESEPGLSTRFRIHFPV